MDFPVELPPKHAQKTLDLKLRADDLREAFVRGKGSGGQKINKTSSCVWLRHRPSGVEVRCQKYREQSKNRVAAYKLLVDKIEEKVKGVESKFARAKFKVKKQKARRSRRAKEKMLEAKHRRSEVKALRKRLRWASPYKICTNLFRGVTFIDETCFRKNRFPKSARRWSIWVARRRDEVWSFSQWPLHGRNCCFSKE